MNRSAGEKTLSLPVGAVFPRILSSMSKLLAFSYLLMFMAGCASYGVIDNHPLTDRVPAEAYTFMGHAAKSRGNSEILLVLSFSGGGTRAAALAYGVLQELRDTTVTLQSGPTRLLDEVDTISSVSGGSFTSAYYGLYGEDTFNTFEDVFLRKNVQSPLISSLFNPFNWFRNEGRMETAVQYYQENIFHDATYADLMVPGRPLIVINASDLAYGIRFSFTQEYFDLLCSDLTDYPVARAVAASSAVPVVFNPIVVENYSGCGKGHPDWLKKIYRQASIHKNEELLTLVSGLESYSDKEQRKYIHFVDGGITDNMGLRAYYDVVSLFGGVDSYFKLNRLERQSRWVLISVDASTTPIYDMGKTNESPSFSQTISAMSGVQLHRYNVASLALLETALSEWTEEVSKPENPVISYFIEVSLDAIQDPSKRQFFNTIPTSFSLNDEQVDKLIDAGRQLLRQNPDFKRLLSDIRESS